MKKKIGILVLVLALLLSACGGDVSRVEHVIGESDYYTQAQIRGAMNEVEKFFRAEFSGCTLTELRYEEEKTGEKQLAWAEDYGAEVIVLLSSFDVDASGGDGSLNPNSTYERYQWILTKTLFGWELKDWGYG